MTPAELRKEIASTHPGWWLRPILEELLRLWEAAENYQRSMHLDEVHDAQCQMNAVLSQLEKIKP